MQNTSGCLLRALRELKRVDEILQALERAHSAFGERIASVHTLCLEGCSAFWANMDGTVQKLAQMKAWRQACTTLSLCS